MVALLIVGERVVSSPHIDADKTFSHGEEESVLLFFEHNNNETKKESQALSH
jgi:hypothetical protein